MLSPALKLPLDEAVIPVVSADGMVVDGGPGSDGTVNSNGASVSLSS